MKPKKVFITFGIVFALFIVACFISLATAKGKAPITKTEQSQSSPEHYELPKVIPVAWFSGI